VFIGAGFFRILLPDWHTGRYCVGSYPDIECVDRLNFYGYNIGPGGIFIVWGILAVSILVGFRSDIRSALVALLISQFTSLLFASAVLSIPQSPLFDLSFPIVAISYSLLFFEIFSLGIFGSLLGVILRGGIRRIMGEMLMGLREKQRTV